ncbi:MAG: precorrin-2 dehydrogenase [Actinomycetota bacterium]|jgi:siroheme synthase-like protein|nr:precorrin-2 dehydrogenase [Actinomycetota bacterium]
MTVAEGAARPGLAGYPVNLLVRGRRVVVVGAGRIAARKIEPLLDAGAVVEVVAPETNDEVRDWAEAGRLVLHRRPFAAPDVEGAWLVLTATDDPAVNAAVHAAAEASRVWVNSADDPANCSFTLMSVIRRGDLVVSVGTGGRSPALAAHLRRRLEEEIGPEYETLLNLLSEAREGLRGTGRSSEDANWQSVFDGGIVELVRTGRVDEARELLRTCLSSSSV